jgi:hypothetical protein
MSEQSRYANDEDYDKESDIQVSSMTKFLMIGIFRIGRSVMKALRAGCFNMPSHDNSDAFTN